MALQNCVKCGDGYSDSLRQCPHCGFEPHIFLCPECGSIHGFEDTECKGCGFRLEQSPVPAGEEDIQAALQKAEASLSKAATLRQAEKNLYFLNLLSSEDGAQELLERNLALVQQLQHQQELEQQYAALAQAKDCQEPEELEQIIALGEALENYRDAAQLTELYREQLRGIRYQDALLLMEDASSPADWKTAANAFDALEGYRDASEKAAQCLETWDTLKSRNSKKARTAVLIVAGAAAAVALAVSAVTFFIPNHFYNSGTKLFAGGQYQEAAEAYRKAGDYKDAPEQAQQALLAQAYADGDAAFAAGSFSEAEQFFLNAGDYQDAADRAAESVLANHHAIGCDHLAKGEFQQAIDAFALAEGYQDSLAKTAEAYYGMADALESAGNLPQAALTFVEAAGHKDAQDRLSSICATLMEAGQFAEAAEAYSLVNTDEGDQHAAYCRGMDAYNRKDYAIAAAAFDQAGQVLNAVDMCRESIYLQGLGLLADKDFSGAKTCFTALGDYERAADLCTLCDAEQKLSEGYLNAATELYSKVPDNLSVEGFDVAARKAQVNKAKPFAAVCGYWNATKNYIESKCQYRFGSWWRNWYLDSPISYQNVVVKCYLNDDGTVRMEGSVTFIRYTSYSTYSYLAKYSSTTKNFKADNLTAVPYNIKLDSVTSMTCSASGFNLKYSKRDEANSDFYYLYNSTVTFGKRTSAY